MSNLKRDIIVTNNALVADLYKANFEVVFTQMGIRQVFEKTRDYIHKGHKLLSHPLSGSVKPNENPYKSILISLDKGNLDLDSLKTIENSILLLNNFPDKYKDIPSKWHNDFTQVDLALIKGAIDNKN